MTDDETIFDPAFNRPSGIPGRIGAVPMAHMNDTVAADVLERLEVEPTDAVLEIGVRPGLGIEYAAEFASDGYVAGVDVSEMMVDRARQRNETAIEAVFSAASSLSRGRYRPVTCSVANALLFPPTRRSGSDTAIGEGPEPPPMAQQRPTLTGEAPAWLKDNVLLATAVLTAVGYAAVAATFAGALPIYPDVGEGGVNLLGHAIAVVNATATICLVAGWRFIRRGEVRKHAASMTAAFVLILLFLLLYLPKVGGGGEKLLVDAAPQAARYAYFAMLAIHILLSAVAMPVVVYAFLLGVTHRPSELYDTAHARIGRIAAASWVLSLVLGVVTYVVLNHVYGYDFVPA